jgi:hypothetical protein
MELNTSVQTRAVRLRCVNHFRAERCTAYSSAGTAINGHMFDVNNDTTGGDGSWGKIYDCVCQQMGLITIGTTSSATNGQVNYWRIKDNYCTMGISVPAAICLNSSSGVVSCEVSNNYFEVGPTAGGPAIYTRGVICSTFVNNYGEMTDLTYPFYDFGGSQNLVLGGRCTSESSGTTGMFVTTSSTADYNTFIIPQLRPASDSTSTQIKDRFTDSNASSRNKWLGNEFLDIEKGFFDMEARATPSNPPSGFRRLFSDNGGSSAATVRTNGGTSTSLET